MLRTLLLLVILSVISIMSVYLYLCAKVRGEALRRQHPMSQLATRGRHLVVDG